MEKKKIKKNLVICIAIIEIVVFFAGYILGMYNGSKNSSVVPKDNKTQVTTDNTNDKSTDEQNISMDTDEKIVQKLLKDMTLSDMVYQMMFVTPEAITKVGNVVQAGETTKKAVE